MRLPSGPLQWREQGQVSSCLDGLTEVGDVVLRRADGFLAYHLATAVDELWLGVSQVVRGEDLWVTTGPQVAVMRLLGCEPPSYWHVPLLLDQAGQRLAKRQGSEGLEAWRASGATAEELIGQWAAQLGWLPQAAELSAVELLTELRRRDGDWTEPKRPSLIPKQ